MKAANIDKEFLIDERKRLGLDIKKKREEAKLTMQQLADKLGTQHSTISKIEAGKYNFGVEYYSAIGVVLGFKLSIKNP